MKKFILLFLLCAVSAFAITTAVTTSYDDCYAACKQSCVEKDVSGDDCWRMCVLQCKVQPEPSLVDATVAAQPVITKALTRGDIVQLPPGKPVSCREQCDWALGMCEKSSYKTDCRGIYEKCVNYCEPQVAPQPPVAVSPPVEMTCEKRCWLAQDECRKAGVDDASCKEKTDVCLRNCNPPENGCKCPTCGPCPVCQPEYLCETECGVRYTKCKAAGAENCGKVVVDCLDQCSPVKPRCEDQCAKIKQVCREQGLTDAQCEPKLKECITRCYPQPMPPVARVKSEIYGEPVPAVAQGEMRQPIAQRMPEKPGVWAKIMSFFKG